MQALYAFTLIWDKQTDIVQKNRKFDNIYWFNSKHAKFSSEIVLKL